MFPGCCCLFNHTVYIYLDLDSKKPVSRYQLSAYFEQFSLSRVKVETESFLFLSPSVLCAPPALRLQPGLSSWCWRLSPYTPHFRHDLAGPGFCSLILSATNTNPQVHSLFSSLTILWAVPREMLLPFRFLITVDFLMLLVYLIFLILFLQLGDQSDWPPNLMIHVWVPKYIVKRKNQPCKLSIGLYVPAVTHTCAQNK